jgi:hypothetical protein
MIKLFSSLAILILSWSYAASQQRQESTGNCSPNIYNSQQANIYNSQQANIYCNQRKAEFRNVQASLYVLSERTNMTLGGGQKKVNLSEQIQYQLLPLSNGGNGKAILLGSVLGDTVDLQLIVTVPPPPCPPWPIPCGRSSAHVYSNFQIQVPFPKSGNIDTQVDLVTQNGQDHLPARLIMSIQ